MTAGRFAALALLALVSLAVGLAVGAVPLSPAVVWRALWHTSDPASPIVRGLRAPRVLLAFGVGGGLAVAGAALQAMIRNPLAEPHLLGLSGGAGLGAVLAIAGRIGGTWTVPVAAFVGALGAVLLVYRLSVVAGQRLDPRVLLLAGVVVGAFSGALMSAVLVLSDSAGTRGAFLWLLGGLNGSSWPALALFVVYAGPPTIVLLVLARHLDLLALGDETARHLGADVKGLRRTVYGCTALVTAASVSACGIIGFVGLIVPHAVRLAIGPLHRTLLPTAFVAGGSFLVIADLIARTVVSPVELPVGVVTALVGVPLFALLLRRTLVR